MTKKSSTGGTCWVFTLNNPTGEEEGQVQELEKRAEVTVMVGGREVGEMGTPHLQGYIEFIAPVTRRALEEAVGEGVPGASERLQAR
jgi:hypothetical protein